MTLRSDRMHRGTSDDHPAGVDGCPICAGVGPARTVRLAPVLTVRVRAALAAALLGVASAGPPGALASVRPAEQSPAAAADATDPGPLDTESGPDPTDPQLDQDAPLVDPDETTDGSDADEQPAPAPATGDASPSPAEAPPTTPADTTPSNPAPSDAAPPAAPPSGASPPAATSPPAAPVAPPAPAAAPRTTAPGAGVALLPDLTPAPMPELESVVDPSATATGTRASDPPSADPPPGAAGALPLASVAIAPSPTTGPAARPSTRSAAATTRRGDRVHVVVQGESLWSIATSALGGDATTRQLAREVDRLWTLNEARMGTGDPDLLLVGTRLRLR